MADHAEHYREVESDLRMLLADLRRDLSPSEANEINVFLIAGEYGLALETLAAIIVEEDKYIDDYILGAVEKLAEKMKLGDSRFIDDVRGFHQRKQNPSVALR